MDEALEQTIRERARNACEYCHLPAHFCSSPFEFEHVIPKQHGGPTVLGNLAFSCLRCNRRKGPNLAGLERNKAGSKLTPLFNPRRHKWSFHFRWHGPYLVGLTAIGRVTVSVLDINDPIRVAIRHSLMALDLFPSPEDVH